MCIAGGTPQANGWMDDWVEFFRERRLKPQLQMAGDAEMSRLGEVLSRNLDPLFEGIEVSQHACSTCRFCACEIREELPPSEPQQLERCRWSRACCMATCGAATPHRHRLFAYEDNEIKFNSNNKS